jgi:hypothetical protein
VQVYLKAFAELSLVGFGTLENETMNRITICHTNPGDVDHTLLDTICIKDTACEHQ